MQVPNVTNMAKNGYNGLLVTMFPHLKPFWIFAKREESFTLEYFLVKSVLLILFVLCAKFMHGMHRKSEKGGKLSYHLSLPRAQWTFCSLSVLDGFITLEKARQDGIKIMDYFVAKYGPQFRMPFAAEDVVVFTDPDIIQKLLSSKDPGHLNKPTAIYDHLMSKFMKKGIFVADVDIWSPHRKAVNGAFNYNQFPSYLKFMIDDAKELPNIYSKETGTSAAGGTLDNIQMKQFLENSIINFTTKFLMGSETFSISAEERAHFQESFLIGKEIVMHRLLHPHLLVPPIWMFHKNKRELDRRIEIGTAFSHKMTDCYRRKKLEQNGESDDNSPENKTGLDNDVTLGTKQYECLIEQMIKAGLSNKEISDEVASFLVGGHETVLVAFDLLLFQLALNPDHQKKCREEFDSVVETLKCPEEDLTVEHFSQLKYLERCILESLRITPAAPGFMRRIDTPLEIDDEYVLEAGQTVAVSSWVMHRNPKIYPNPEIFDPDRFLPENVKKRHSHSFIPFSMGPRNCIGWKIAMLEMKLFTAWILRHFEFTTTDKADDVKIMFNVTLRPERPYNITFTKREV